MYVGQHVCPESALLALWIRREFLVGARTMYVAHLVILKAELFSGILFVRPSLVRLAVPYVHATICYDLVRLMMRDLCCIHCRTVQVSRDALLTSTGEAPQTIQPELDVQSNLGEARSPDLDPEPRHGLPVPRAPPPRRAHRTRRTHLDRLASHIAPPPPPSPSPREVARDGGGRRCPCRLPIGINAPMAGVVGIPAFRWLRVRAPAVPFLCPSFAPPLL